MKIFAIDPGPEVSGWVLFDSEAGSVIECGSSTPTLDVLGMLRSNLTPGGNPITGTVACEMIASYGMAVGESVFDTCVWIGRMKEACENSPTRPKFRRIKRQPVKLHLCHSPRAKDANVAQALKDKLGEAGTKKNPGPLFGVSKHAWAALAVAVYACEVPEAEGQA